MQIKILTILIFAFCGSALTGQITQEEVNKEAKFIEAKRENIIGRYDKGIDILTDLYKDDRSNSEIAFELAKAYKVTNEHELVEKYGQSAIKNDPSNIWYQLFFGDYMMERNQPETAIKSFKKIVEYAPNDPQNYDRLAKAYIVVKDYKQASSTYDALEKKIGSTVDVIMNKFRTYDLAGDYTNAKAQINRLTTKYPKVEDYWLITAQVELNAGNISEAKAAYKKVLEINPNNSEANVAMLGEGTPTENENTYLRALIPIIENPSISIDAKIKELLPYVENLAKGQDLELKDALIQAGDRLVQTHNNEPKATALNGDILYNTGNIKAAIKQYEKTIELDDSVFPVWEQLMYALEEEEDYDKLVKVSEEAMDYYPNQAMALYFHGIGLSKKGSHSDAKEILSEAIIIAGKRKVVESTIYNALASNAIDAKNYVEAKEFIDKSLSISDNKNPLTFEVLGDLHYAQKNLKEAIDNWEKSSNMGNTSTKLSNKIEANKS
jgi:tetratricopeptide (TPR) repeat protein